MSNCPKCREESIVNMGIIDSKDGTLTLHCNTCSCIFTFNTKDSEETGFKPKINIVGENSWHTLEIPTLSRIILWIDNKFREMTWGFMTILGFVKTNISNAFEKWIKYFGKKATKFCLRHFKKYLHLYVDTPKVTLPFHIKILDECINTFDEPCDVTYTGEIDGTMAGESMTYAKNLTCSSMCLISGRDDNKPILDISGDLTVTGKQLPIDWSINDGRIRKNEEK